jgi:hypothetical protein
MSKPHVLATHPLFDEARQILQESCDMQYWSKPERPSREELLRLAKNQDGLVCLLTEKIDDELFRAAPKLRIVSNVAVGFDNIDIPACTKHTVVATNTPGVLDETTADFAWTLLLAVARRLVEADQSIRSGLWKGWNLDQFCGADVWGKTLGIVGFGRIGRSVARRASGFQMKVIYSDAQRAPEDVERSLHAEYRDLNALLAEAEDQADVPDGLSIPEELALREKRLAKLAEARAKIEARAKERYERERAEHEAKLAAREAKTAATGKKPGGKPPAPPVEGPLPKDQINLTDEDSRIMPAPGGGFEQAYNAQAAVAAGSLLVVAADVAQAPNDKQQLEPMLDKIEALPERLGAVETLLADAGYFSAANVEACREATVEPLIAMGRQPHHPPLGERFAKEGPAPENPTPVEAMAHRLKTPEGRKLYALRKQTPEPVFGIIKSALGFRQFLLRGLDKVRGEWSLVTMAWNLKRMFVLAPA